MAGQVQVVVGNIGAATPLVTGGKLRALAVTSAERSKMLPDVPTVAESGFPGFENSGWFGLLAPAGTPQGRHRPRATRYGCGAGSSPMWLTRLQGHRHGRRSATRRQRLAAAIDAESKVWADVIKSRKIKAN